MIGRYTYTHRLREGFMKHAVGMGSGTLIHIPSFIKIGSGIQKFTWGESRHTDNMEMHKPTFIFFPK
jgi:hypothetical protein